MRNNDREKKLRKLLHPNSMARFSNSIGLGGGKVESSETENEQEVMHVLESKYDDEALMKPTHSTDEEISLATNIPEVPESSNCLEKEPNSNKSESSSSTATVESLQCISCDKMYKQKASFIKHMASNHDVDNERNLQCKICDKTFTTLKKSMRHQKESKCKDKII